MLHAKIKIGDSVLEMGEAHGPFQSLPSMLFLYVDDVDAWHRRAVAGGATEIDKPKDQVYGDRVSSVSDHLEIPGTGENIAEPINNRTTAIKKEEKD